jgi:hypothetical protein
VGDPVISEPAKHEAAADKHEAIAEFLKAADAETLAEVEFRYEIDKHLRRTQALDIPLTDE